MTRLLNIHKFRGNKGFEDILLYDRWKKKAIKNFKKKYGGTWTVLKARLKGEVLEERIAAKKDLETDVNRRLAYLLTNLIISKIEEYVLLKSQVGIKPEFDEKYVDEKLDYARNFFLKINDEEGLGDLIEISSRVFYYTRIWKYKHYTDSLKEEYDERFAFDYGQD